MDRAAHGSQVCCPHLPWPAGHPQSPPSVPAPQHRSGFPAQPAGSKEQLCFSLALERNPSRAAGTQTSPQHLKPPKSPQIPSTGEHHRNTEQGGDCWANPLARQDPELSACDLLVEFYPSEEKSPATHWGALPGARSKLAPVGMCHRSLVGPNNPHGLGLALGVVLLLVPSGGSTD